jgi:hypothetical protein
MPQPSENSTSSVSGGFALPALPARVSNAAGAARTATIPADLGTHELRLPRPPVDQRQVNCCVSCALGAAMEIISPGKPSLAPLFHYYITRSVFFGGLPDGSLNLDVALAVLSVNGICLQKLHPFKIDAGNVDTPPSSVAIADGQTRALTPSGFEQPYQPASGPSRSVWAREQLRLNRPVVIGFVLPLSYPAAFNKKGFIWRDPESLSLSNSGHCVVATGYNDAFQALHIRDSRGVGMFDAGYWWLGYRVVDSLAVQSVYSLNR